MITTKQRSVLRGMANSLKPTVTIGKSGLTPNIVKEIEIGLYHNEMIKITLLPSCEITAREVAEQVSKTLAADVVQCIGKKAVFYKFSDKEGIEHLVF